MEAWRDSFLNMIRGQKSKGGRPRRPDDPTHVHVRLAGELRAWLKQQAEHERRAEGLVIEDALAAYRQRVARRKGRS
jgi:hypothetical protein